MQPLTKIFIPIQDEVLDHWFFIVANMTGGECEIWDSIPDLPAQKRRHNYVHNVMALLQSVFGMQLRDLNLPQLTQTAYSFTYPAPTQTLANHYDSGIITIRSMQYYPETCYSVLHSAQERVKIAIEIVNNPMNRCYNLVWDADYREQVEGVASND